MPRLDFSQRNQRILLLIASLLLAGGLVVLFYLYFPIAVDWRDSYQPAALAFLRGESPYQVTSFYNPPWILPLLAPVALLDTKWGGAVWDVITLVIFICAAYRLGAKIPGILAVTFSYPLLFNLFYGQIDALVVLGYVLPPPIGIFLVLAKPQIGAGVVVFWAVEAFRKKGWRGLLQLFGPVGVVGAGTYLLYGAWFAHAGTPIGQVFNSSLWPLSIPIGLVLLIYALRCRRMNLSIVASPFLSPYMGPHSWAIPVLGLAPDSILMVAASLGLWVTAYLTGGWLH